MVVHILCIHFNDEDVVYRHNKMEDYQHTLYCLFTFFSARISQITHYYSLFIFFFSVFCVKFHCSFAFYVSFCRLRRLRRLCPRHRCCWCVCFMLHAAFRYICTMHINSFRDGQRLFATARFLVDYDDGA